MKRIFFILLSCALCAGLIYSAYTLGITLLGSPQAASVFATGSGIDISLRITDENGLPMQGVTLDIAETSHRVNSDEDGNISVQDLKENPDHRFDSILAKPWSEYTLILSKPGYLSYVMLDYALSAEYERESLEVVMFPLGTTDSEDAICLVDSPPREWVNALVQMY